MIVCIGTTPVYQRTMVLARLTVDAVNRTADVHDYPSGKAINAARVLKELGEEEIVVGFAGGSRGRLMLEELQQSGIRHDFVSIEQNTRQCITLIDCYNGTATEIVEEAQPVDAAAWQQLETKLRHLADEASAGDVWLFSGTLPPGTPDDAYARLVPMLLAKGIRVIADVQGEPLLQMLQQKGIIAKLNRDEFGSSMQVPVKSDASLREAVKLAVRTENAIVITLGKDGALAGDKNGLWRISSPKISAVSAVGSGDSFAAGLAAGLRRGLTLHEACALASACGAANAETPYAGHLQREEAERLLGEVTIKPA